MPLSPEITAKIEEWRRRSVANEMTLEEYREAITALRADRVGAHFASTTSRTRKVAAAAPVDTAGLLAGLMKPAAAE